MISEPEFNVADQMVEQGLLEEIDTELLSGFLAGEGLRVLFFSGPSSVRREAHDTAVALRELLRDYAGQCRAARFSPDTESSQLEAFRVSATPCLVFLAAGEVLEVMPRVRDWVDYAEAFRRYLGDARPLAMEGAA